MKTKKQSAKAPSQRQLRVAEQIRHALAEVFVRGECHELDGMSSISVSEVRISPDLKHATAYVVSLLGQEDDEALSKLNAHAPLLRHLLSSKLQHMKFSPKLFFRNDDSFDEAQKINHLLNKPEVQRDISSSEDKA